MCSYLAAKVLGGTGRDCVPTLQLMYWKRLCPDLAANVLDETVSIPCSYRLLEENVSLPCS